MNTGADLNAPTSETAVPLQDPTKLDELIRAMTTLHDDLPKFRRAARKAWKGTVAAVVVGVAAIVIGLGAITIGLTNRTDVHELDRIKEENTVTMCFALNDLIVDIREALVNSLVLLAKDPNNLTEREQQIVAAYTAQVEKELVLIDCSEEGIEALRERYAR